MKGHPDDVAPRITWASNSELKIQSSSTNRQYFAKSSYGWFNKVHIRYGEENAKSDYGGNSKTMAST